MFEKFLFRASPAVAAAALLASTAGGVTIQTVPVGNPGNANDSTGFGGVAAAYQIGKYEVTAGQYTEFLNAVAATDTYGLYHTSMWSDPFGCKIQRSGSSGNYTYSVPDPLRVNRPVNYVSFWDAARFANWLHNGQGGGDTESGAYINIGDQSTFARQPGARWFIPTENEWYKAAYHKNDGVTGNYYDYPTRSDGVPSNHLIEPDPGNNANFYQGGYTIGSPYYTTPVGEFENSQSPYDTFDQGGNAWEWNETVVLGSSRGVRGGNWHDGFSTLAASTRIGKPPAYEHGYLGFRVASVPEPGCMTLLVSGLFGALIWWRRRK